MAWPRLRQGGTESAAVARPRRNELLGAVGERSSLPTAWMQPDYSASGVGFSGGGSIPNVLAVMQVIEKLPVDATSATRPSSPMVLFRGGIGLVAEALVCEKLARHDEAGSLARVGQIRSLARVDGVDDRPLDSDRQ